MSILMYLKAWDLSYAQAYWRKKHIVNICTKEGLLKGKAQYDYLLVLTSQISSFFVENMILLFWQNNLP